MEEWSTLESDEEDFVFVTTDEVTAGRDSANSGWFLVTPSTLAPSPQSPRSPTPPTPVPPSPPLHFPPTPPLLDGAPLRHTPEASPDTTPSREDEQTHSHETSDVTSTEEGDGFPDFLWEDESDDEKDLDLEAFDQNDPLALDSVKLNNKLDIYVMKGIRNKYSKYDILGNRARKRNSYMIRGSYNYPGLSRNALDFYI